MSHLRSTLKDLATSFAEDVLAALRTASLDELAADGHGAGNGRRTRVQGGGGQPDPLHTPKPKNGRLARRSPEDVAKTLGLVVAALKGTQGKGMRAEEIRKFLNIDVRELPRVLGEGLKTKKLRSTGQKRATTYFAR